MFAWRMVREDTPTCEALHAIRNMRQTLSVLVLLIFLTACVAPFLPPDVPTPRTTAVLRLGISSGANQFMALVEEPFAEERPFLHLEWTIANDTALYAKLADGSLDAALFHIIPGDNTFWFNPVALDGLAILVNPENGVGELTLSQVQGLFNGRLSNWQSVGGVDLPVTLVSREQGAGARILLQQQVLATQPLHVNALIETDQARLMTAIVADATVIGAGLMGAVSDEVKIVAVNGRLPTPNEVGTQNYALTTPLYFVTSSIAEPEGELRDFLAWLQSPAGQSIISQRYGRIK